MALYSRLIFWALQPEWIFYLCVFFFFFEKIDQIVIQLDGSLLISFDFDSWLGAKTKENLELASILLLK